MKSLIFSCVATALGFFGLNMIATPALAGTCNGVAVPASYQGGAYNDYIVGNGVANAINGAGASDKVLGEAGADNVCGSNGRDVVIGGNGNDLLFGDDDCDAVIGDAGQDDLRGNEGDDTSYTAYGGCEIPIWSYLGGMNGMDGDDVLYGQGGNDLLLNGPTGYETFYGGTGSYDVCDGSATWFYDCEIFF